MFVFSAWALIFNAMNTAHYYSAANVGIDGPSTFSSEASPSCAYSMEIMPVTYTDEHGRRGTAWETDVRNCWGGSVAVSSMPDNVRRHFNPDAERASERFALLSR